MKRCVMLAMFLSASLCIGGCWDRTELNDLALVSAMAFDKTENDRVQVTVQIIIPQNLGNAGIQVSGAGGGGGGGAKKTTTRSETGVNVADALSKLQGKVPRKLFWGQCKIYIFGESLAKAGIRDAFDFMVRSPQIRERAFVFVSKGNASKLLDQFPPIERSSAEVLREFGKLHIGFGVTVQQLSMMLKGEARASILPLVRVVPAEKMTGSQPTVPDIVGTAVFHNDKMTGEMSLKSTRGVMWVRNEIQEYTVTFLDEQSGGYISLKPVKASTKLLPTIAGDQWIMTVKVHTEGDIIENGTPINPMNPDLLNRLNTDFANEVKERIQLAIDDAQQKLRVDILNFSKEYHRKYPKQWEQAKERWNEQFPKVEVKIDIRTQINRPGLTGPTGGLPKEEVKQS